MKRLLPTALSALLFVLASPAIALEPGEIVIVANSKMPDSLDVAEHYCQKRGVPKENIVALDLPTAEDISRPDYNAKLVAPLRAALKDRKEKIKCLLCVYGVPLRVGPVVLDAEKKAELAKVEAELKQAEMLVKTLETKVKELSGDAVKAVQDELKTARQKQLDLRRRHNMMSPRETEAAVDSELMVLWLDEYQFYRFVINPLHFQTSERLRKQRPNTLMTARLDGPTPALAKRLVDDAVEVEKVGLKGKVYVDARGIKFDTKTDTGHGYGGYDESMREMAALLKDEGRMDVVLDDKPELFKPGTCPECAIYCGWYSLANYIDSCRFVKGAVAWHLASSEAVSLRQKNSKLWCINILEKGACATLGPVAEPYTAGFPKPEEFFGFLVTGEFTLVESYARSQSLASWMVTLIGDPLYNPFKANPRLKSEKVKPSPKGGRFIEALRG